MRKFIDRESLEVGDHVLIAAPSDEYSKMNGKYGIIRHCTDDKRSFAVEFFESIPNTLHNCNNTIPSSRGYWFPHKSLRKMVKTL